MSFMNDIGSALSTGMQNVGNFIGQGFQDLTGGGGLGNLSGTAGQAATSVVPSMAATGENIGSAMAGLDPSSIGAMFGSAPGGNLADIGGAIGRTADTIPGLPQLGGAYAPLTGGDVQPFVGPSSIQPGVGGAGETLGMSVPANAQGNIGGGNFLQNLLKDPKMLMGGAMLGADLLNANKKPPGLAQLQAMAQGQGQFAKNQGELAMAEQQGMLPAGATNLFQGVLSANEAAIRSKYASMGMTGSTAEMQDLAAAREAILGQMQQAGMQMAQAGWANVNQATGYESQLLTESMNAQLQQQKDLQDALANFAGAFTDLSGGKQKYVLQPSG